MRIGIVGRKCGMTRIFTDEGASVPVTVIEASPNHVTQIKSVETDGYSAVQVTTGFKSLPAFQSPKPESLLKQALKLVEVIGSSDQTIPMRRSK